MYKASVTLGIVALAFGAQFLFAQTGQDTGLNTGVRNPKPARTVPDFSDFGDNQSTARSERPARTSRNTARAKLINGYLVVPDGDVTIMEELQAEVAAKRPGVLKTVELNRTGLPVQAGMLIASIEDEAARVTLEIAEEKAKDEVEKEYAEKVRDIAKKVLQRYISTNKKAASKGSTPIFGISELEEKKLEVERSDLQIKKAVRDKLIATLDVKKANVELKEYTIKAPIGGRVTRVEKQIGEAVSLGDVILEITDYSRMKVTGKIPVQFRDHIQKGVPVKVRIAITKDGPKMDIEKREFEGKVFDIEQEVDRAYQEFKVYVEVANQKDDRGLLILQEGMIVELKIPENRRGAVR